MGVLQGNDIYLTINGVNVTARWREFIPDLDAPEEDTSAGAGIDWASRGTKLLSMNSKIILVYDDVAAANDQAALWDDTLIVPIVYGPEGNESGKPCHDADFKISKINGPATKQDKSRTEFEYAIVSTGTPRKNIYAGDTF